MHAQTTFTADAIRKRKKIFLTAGIFLSVITTVLLDKLESVYQGTGFYLSESFMFSSIWWLVAPILLLQFHYSKRTGHILGYLACMITPLAVHLFAYPALVWIISKICYSHTFRYWQTFNYGLTEHFLMLAFIYISPMVCYIVLKTKKNIVIDEPMLPPITGKQFLQTLIVSEGNKHLTIQVADIIYISANSPYIDLHHKHRKYLYNSTLRSLEEKLDTGHFVRIHRSAIINITYLRSYRSRNNGDYDIVMMDESELRVSRNYAADFKAKLQPGTQLTTT